MNAKELRLGNIVTWIDSEESDKCTIVLTGIVSDGTIWVEWVWGNDEPDNTDCDLESIKGIELTDYWVERLGFEYDHEERTWSKLTGTDKFDICFEIENKHQEHFQPWFLGIDIKYVHELQNLFFAITGAELKLENAKR